MMGNISRRDFIKLGAAFITSVKAATAAGNKRNLSKEFLDKFDLYKRLFYRHDLRGYLVELVEVTDVKRKLSVYYPAYYTTKGDGKEIMLSDKPLRPSYLFLKITEFPGLYPDRSYGSVSFSDVMQLGDKNLDGKVDHYSRLRGNTFLEIDLSTHPLTTKFNTTKVDIKTVFEKGLERLMEHIDEAAKSYGY